jgi:uncharacterized protein YgiM (DUF1202 family)
MNTIRIFSNIAVSLAVCLFALQASAQETYYVQSVKAKVMSAASFKANVLGEVNRGTRIGSTGREGSWVKINYNGKAAYVAAILLSVTPPMTKHTMIKADNSEFQQGVRRRASTYTSAAAARGLAADDRRRLSGDDKLDYDGLERVEKFSVTDTDLAKFMEGGKI